MEITRLPYEMIEHILCSESLSIIDVLNFSLTNPYYNHIVANSNIIWRKKYFQTWPQFAELFDNNLKYDWYAEVRYIYDLKPRTREILSTMSSRYLHRYLLTHSELSEWLELYQEKPQTYYYLVEDLSSIIADTDLPIDSIEVIPVDAPGKKTPQYYAIKALKYLRRMHLSEEWKAFLALPRKQQTLEKMLVFLARWFKPHADVSVKDFAAKLDELAEKVKEYLKMDNPGHPVFFVQKEKQKIWRDENLERSEYGYLHCRLITDAVGKLRWANGIVKFLEEIISGGFDKFVFLSLHESVARRLGVKYEPVILSLHFALRYSERNNTDGSYYYIDNTYWLGLGGRHLGICFPVATMQQVLEHTARNLVGQFSRMQFTSTVDFNTRAVIQFHSSCELLQLVVPFDQYARDCLARLYMEHNMNATAAYIDAIMQL